MDHHKIIAGNAWHHEKSQAGLSGAGTWPVRLQARAKQPIWHIAPDIERTRYPYIPVLHRYRARHPSFWDPTSVYPGIGCQNRSRYRRKTRYRGYIGLARSVLFGISCPISKTFSSISGVVTRYRGYIGLAKSVLLEYRMLCRSFFLRYRTFFFDIEFIFFDIDVNLRYRIRYSILYLLTLLISKSMGHSYK